MIRRFLCVCSVLILQLVWDDCRGGVRAEVSPDLIVGDLPSSEDGVLRAFTPPDRKESELAASRVFGVLLGVVIFVVFLLIILACFYSKKSGLPKPTILRKVRKDPPSNQREKEPQERTRYIIDEE